jgi:hypothetical protein
MTISGGKHKPNEEKTNQNLRKVFFKASVLVGLEETGSICYASAPMCPFAFLSSQGMKEDFIWFNPMAEAQSCS